MEIKTPYLTQQKAIRETVRHLNNGKTKIINVQFCGLGKTELGAWISKRIKGKILFVVHKNQILNQAYETYSELIKGRSFGFFNSEFKEKDKDVVFATIQTISRKKNLSKFQREEFECIIIDECHHMANNSYNKLLKYFDNRYLLGFTATPDRLDKKPILELFDEKVGFFDDNGNDISLRMGIEMGYLCPLRYFGLNDNIDYSKIKHNGFVYNKKDLDKELIIKKRNKLIVKKWKAIASGKKTIAFCNSVKHCNRMQNEFEKQGVKSICLNYKTNKRMQKVIEQQFRQGLFDIILTVDLYIEGVDFPDCECVMFLRPTESERIFVQQLGRVMRIYNGKRFGQVMDFVGNQKNANDRKKWIKKRLLGEHKLDIPIESKPIYYYDPLVQIRIDEEVVDIFRGKQVKGRTKEELLDIYEKVKKLLGHPPSATEIAKYGNVSYSTFANRFGSWENFKKELGDQKKHTKERIVKQFKEFYKKHKHYPTIREIREYKLISDNTIRNLWGSYAKFITDIGGQPRKNTKLDLNKDGIIKDYFAVKKKLGTVPFSYEMDKELPYSFSSAIRQFFNKHGEYGMFLKETIGIKDYNGWIKRNRSIDKLRTRNLLGSVHHKYSKKQIETDYIKVYKKIGRHLTQTEIHYRKFRELPSTAIFQKHLKLKDQSIKTITGYFDRLIKKHYAKDEKGEKS